MTVAVSNFVTGTFYVEIEETASENNTASENATFFDYRNSTRLSIKFK
jgi:hypothetical protein